MDVEQLSAETDGMKGQKCEQLAGLRGRTRLHGGRSDGS